MVADDQPVICAGFAALLGAQPDLDVVGTAADGAQLVDLVARLRSRRTRWPRPASARAGTRCCCISHEVARTKEIASEMVIGTETVKSHVGEVLRKLGLHDRIQAVVFAYEHGLVVPRAPEP